MSASALWLQWPLAAVMVAIAGHHLNCVIGAVRRGHRVPLAVNLTHAAMGLVMALMLVGRLKTTDARTLAMGFAVPAGWFGWQTLRVCQQRDRDRIAPPLVQTLISVAMVYMLVQASAAGSGAPTHGGSAMNMPGMQMAAMTGGGHAVGGSDGALFNWLTIVMVAATLGVSMWTATRLWAPRQAPPAPRPTRANRTTATVASGCQLAMSVTTMYMLVLMV